MRSTYTVFIRKPEEKRPLRRPKYMWEDDIKMDHKEMQWKVLD
jgi:hypothetical protein